MARLRRRTLHNILEGAALGLVALDLVVYLGLARPLSSAVKSQQERFNSARQQMRMTEIRIGQAQVEIAALPGTAEEMKEFLDEHVPPRRRGYSRAAGLVHKLTDDSGVQLKRVAYRLSEDPKDPLERLGIQVNVEGGFESLLKFTHALETSNDFLLVRGIIVQPGEDNGLGLRVLAELYVTP